LPRSFRLSGTSGQLGYNSGISSPPEEAVAGHFRLGPWLVQPSLNLALRSGATRRLTPKAMEVLVCLAQHAGEPVAKEQLLQTVWSDTFVGDDVLKRVIVELRRVFEDDVNNPKFIQTITKRGYRLIAHVKWVDAVLPGQAKPENASVSVARSRRLLMLGSAARRADLV